MGSPKHSFLANTNPDNDYLDNLLHVNRNEYKPGQISTRLHKSLARKRLNVGGLGCIRESTRILTNHGEVPCGDLRGPDFYLSFGEGQYRWSLGTAPFPKGKENLYRVVHKFGEFVAAGHHLVFCKDGSYRRVLDLIPGDDLPYLYEETRVSPGLPETNSELYLSKLPLGGERCYEKHEDCLDDCEALIRRCGPQLLYSLADGQFSFESQKYVREFFRTVCCVYRSHQEHHAERLSKHTHLSLLFSHPSMQDYIRRQAALAWAVEGRILPIASERTSADIQRERQFQMTCESRPTNSLSSGQAFSRLSSCTKTTLTSIERLNKKEWYWDLQVPGDNNYIAEGVIHHNSGKSRTMVEHLNQMCLTYPGGNVVLARKDLGDLKKTAQAEYLSKAVVPETIERFNVNDNTLYYKNGSKCFFMECKTPSNFKSLELIAYGVEEADENEEGVGKDRLMTMLDGRLRQRISIDGRNVPVPYCGIWTYNPTTDDHWLAKLEDKPEYAMEVFRSSTYDNQQNLPPDYIPNLIATLAPWEIQSLVFGNRAKSPKGKPVLHGFTLEENVRQLKIFPHLPLIRGWDFGFNHPCISLSQYDPEFKRLIKHRELLGNKEQLQFFAPKAIALSRALVGPGFTIFDTCDPHGKDQRDVGDSSVEYLRIHHQVHCNTKRQQIKTGLDEMQELIITRAPFRPVDWTDGQEIKEESRLLIDASCRGTIAAYMGGYYRNAEGKPEKDDLHDHYVDTDRYIVVNQMNSGLAYHRKKNQNRYVPTDPVTGYRARSFLKKLAMNPAEQMVVDSELKKPSS